ncbi:MAG: nicotinate phosphoribosyltransferase [Thermodesulfobacteriota bacterium]
MRLSGISGLYTDYYELTMAQGYFLSGKKDDTAVFDYFFRVNPFDGGYVIFAGLDTLLEALSRFVYGEQDRAYLRERAFTEAFLAFLKDFRFRGTICSVREGEVVFPQEPLVRVEGTIIECQLIETLLLNVLNFESLIATKASRVRRAAGDRPVSDFGLRRAQGMGGLQASRAAVIGGVDATSNVLAGQRCRLPVAGTQAHSWVQSFDDELAAFRAYARLYPDNTILLVDTYDTLHSGLPNAILVGLELKEAGQTLKAVRLDSGDLAYLSKQARRMLDEAGLTETKILASNQLDEYLIRSLNEQQAPIDGFGVGTELVTGKTTAALDGVYKLAAYNGQPTLKLSNTLEKISLPGKKETRRYFNGAGKFYADCVCLVDEGSPEEMAHPFERDKHCALRGLASEPLQKPVMEGGEIISRETDVIAMREYGRKRLAFLPEEHKRFEMPHIYKVGLSPRLEGMRDEVIKGLSVKF